MKIFKCCIIQGDSGGPLTYESNGQHILIGVTSFGPGRCTLFQEDSPYGVFARISHYREWIESKMSNPVFCSGTASADTGSIEET